MGSLSRTTIQHQDTADTAMPDNQTVTNYSVPNLERSFIIMEHLSQSSEGCTLTELVKFTGFPQNSIFRICRTLGELGYVTRNHENKRFLLTQRILNLAVGAVSPGKNIVPIAAPYLKEIAQKTGETCCLGTIVDTKGVVLAVEDGSHPFRFHIDLGISFHLHTSAPGKAMLATLQDRQSLVNRLEFPSFTKRTITTPTAFLDHLEDVEQCGYGTDREEEFAGQHCIGSAIQTRSGVSACSIWITAPSSRLKVADFPRVGKLIRNACLDIEGKLEYQ